MLFTAFFFPFSRGLKICSVYPLRRLFLLSWQLPSIAALFPNGSEKKIGIGTNTARLLEGMSHNNIDLQGEWQMTEKNSPVD